MIYNLWFRMANISRVKEDSHQNIVKNWRKSRKIISGIILSEFIFPYF